MPIGGKLFKYREPVDFDKVLELLAEYNESYMVNGYEITERFEASVEDTGEIVGYYYYDVMHEYIHHTDSIYAPETKVVIFYLWTQGEVSYLLIVAPKIVANKTAQKFVEILEAVGDLTEARLSGEVLREYAEAHEKTSIAFFDNIDLVNMEKATLYAGEGGHVAQTTLWGDYLSHGIPWYIMGREKSHGYTVGLVRDGSVCIFNNIDPRIYYEFVKDEVIDMVLRTHQYL